MCLALLHIYNKMKKQINEEFKRMQALAELKLAVKEKWDRHVLWQLEL